MEHLIRKARGYLASEGGQDLAEYALLIGLIALVVLVAVSLLGGNLSLVFGRMGAVFAKLSGRIRPVIGTPIASPYP